MLQMMKNKQQRRAIDADSFFVKTILFQKVGGGCT